MTSFCILYAKLCGNGLTPILLAPLKRRKACSDHGRLQKINNAAASLRHLRKNNCPTEEGEREGRRRGRGVEGRGGRLDDRMAAFTQRLFSPAETRFHVQHDGAALRSHLQLISTPPRSASHSRLFGFVLFWCLMRRASAPDHAPCERGVSAKIRRTKRAQPFSKNKPRISAREYSG